MTRSDKRVLCLSLSVKWFKLKVNKEETKKLFCLIISYWEVLIRERESNESKTILEKLSTPGKQRKESKTRELRKIEFQQFVPNEFESLPHSDGKFKNMRKKNWIRIRCKRQDSSSQSNSDLTEDWRLVGHRIRKTRVRDKSKENERESLKQKTEEND